MAQALGELFMLHRDRLWRMLYVRLDRRLVSRVSPDDVLQETFLDVSRSDQRVPRRPRGAVLRLAAVSAVQRMQIVQRTHLGAQMRAVSREVHARARRGAAGVGRVDGRATRQSHDVAQPGRDPERIAGAAAAALEAMDPLDREVLALRHFEELGNNEVAQVFRIAKEAASKRHIRALMRLREIFGAAEANR